MINTPDNNWQNEILYQIFPRSFYDSNDDGHGDFDGILSKIDYLQELGVTALWLNPIFDSPTDHNYFPNDFFTTDPQFGTNTDFHRLVDALHDRGIKILIDMETQYVTRDHKWFTDSFNNPDSQYSDHILYRDKNNSDPVCLSLIMPDADGKNREYVIKQIISMNLNNPGVLEFQKKIFRYWIDPTGDGSCRHGVDGFRMDHIMDNLDYRGILTGLFKKLWRPVVTHTRSIQPDTFYISETADWSIYDKKMLSDTGMEATFDIPLMFAIHSLDKQTIIKALKRRRIILNKKKQLGVIIENHDVNRFATEVDDHPDKLRIGATLNILIEGTPVIYYGQELGMNGKLGSWGEKHMHRPVRQAFKWSSKKSDKGIAFWYEKEAGKNSTNFDNNTVIPFNEQHKDPGSLWNFYKRLIAIRKENIALREGSLEIIVTDQEQVLAFTRTAGKRQTVCVILNLSDDMVKVNCTFKRSCILSEDLQPVDMLTANRVKSYSKNGQKQLQLELIAWEVLVFKLSE